MTASSLCECNQLHYLLSPDLNSQDVRNVYVVSDMSRSLPAERLGLPES